MYRRKEKDSKKNNGYINGHTPKPMPRSKSKSNGAHVVMSMESVEEQLKAKQKQKDQQNAGKVSKSATLSSNGHGASPSPLKPNKLDFNMLNLSKSAAKGAASGPEPLSSDFFDSLIAPTETDMDLLFKDIAPECDMFGVKRKVTAETDNAVNETQANGVVNGHSNSEEDKSSQIINLKAASSNSAGPRKLMIKKKSTSTTPVPSANGTNGINGVNGHSEEVHHDGKQDGEIGDNSQKKKSSASAMNGTSSSSSHKNGHHKSRVKMVEKKQSNAHHQQHPQHHRHHLGLVWDALKHCQQTGNSTPRRKEMFKAMKKVHPDYMRGCDLQFANECIDSCLAAGVVEELMEGRISSLYILPVILNALTNDVIAGSKKSNSGHVWITLNALKEHLAARYTNHLATYFTLTYIYRIISNATSLFAFHKDDKHITKRHQNQVTDDDLESIRFRLRKMPNSSTSPISNGRSVSPPYGSGTHYDYMTPQQQQQQQHAYRNGNGYYRQHHGHRNRNPNHYNYTAY